MFSTLTNPIDKFNDVEKLPETFESTPFTFETLVCKNMNPIHRYFISKSLICKNKLDINTFNEFIFDKEEDGYYYYRRNKIKTVGFYWCWFPNFNKEYYSFLKLVKHALYEKKIQDAEINMIIYPSKILDIKKINIQITGEHQIHNPLDFHLTLANINDTKTRQITYPYFCQVIDTYSKYEKLFEDTNNTNIPNQFCAFIHSNSSCHTRNDFFQFLCSKYKMVNSYGRLYNNMNKIYEYSWRQPEQIDLYKQNKFGLCFENSRDDTDYYITEKMLNVKLSGAIPIYWGTAKCLEMFEKESFLFLEDSSKESYEKLLKQIIELDKDELKYLAMRNKRLINPEKIKHLRIESLTREF